MLISRMSCLPAVAPRNSASATSFNEWTAMVGTWQTVCRALAGKAARLAPVAPSAAPDVRLDTAMKSRQGQLLIASSRLRDPNFFKSVVLIVKDSDEGALGVILNRPLEITVADACGEQVPAASEVDEPIHQGGPCEGPLTVLHGNPAAGEIGRASCRERV